MKSSKTNFYFKTESYLNEAIEVYVGQSSGKQLNQDILRAKKEVLIISPYIDESKLEDLISLKNRGVNVRIAFSDLNSYQRYNVLRKLIHQQKYVDLKLKEVIKKKSNNYFFLTISFLIVGIVLFLYSILYFKGLDIKILITFLFSLLSFYGFYRFKILKKEVDKTPINRYEYFEKINFKYLRNNFNSDDKMFIHSKIYIIDREIAYMGSLNYTNNGFTTNFETRVRITQSDKINDLVDFVHNIFDDNDNFKSHELWYLGKQVYSEEKY